MDNPGSTAKAPLNISAYPNNEKKTGRQLSLSTKRHVQNEGDELGKFKDDKWAQLQGHISSMMNG